MKTNGKQSETKQETRNKIIKNTQIKQSPITVVIVFASFINIINPKKEN